jgi:hypothetical protein
MIARSAHLREALRSPTVPSQPLSPYASERRQRRRTGVGVCDRGSGRAATTLKHVCCPKYSYLGHMLQFIFIFLQNAARKTEQNLYNDGIG